MNHKIKRKWCAALRGGTWTQIEKQYSDAEQGRCALGVLAEVTKADDPKNYRGITTYLRDHVPAVVQNEVVAMNDSGVSFLDIADWIEKYL